MRYVMALFLLLVIMEFLILYSATLVAGFNGQALDRHS